MLKTRHMAGSITVIGYDFNVGVYDLQNSGRSLAPITKAMCESAALLRKNFRYKIKRAVFGDS